MRQLGEEARRFEVSLEAERSSRAAEVRACTCLFPSLERASLLMSQIADATPAATGPLKFSTSQTFSKVFKLRLPIHLFSLGWTRTYVRNANENVALRSFPKRRFYFSLVCLLFSRPTNRAAR